MKSSTTRPKAFSLAVVFWLLLWQGVAMLVGEKILLASPLETLQALFSLSLTGTFWTSAFFSLGRILSGFLGAVCLACLLAGLSARLHSVSLLLAPLFSALRSIPVASFVIVALIWVPSQQLSVLISFLIAMPILYAGILCGIESTDSQLLEMAQVFGMGNKRRLFYLYIPAVFPYFQNAAVVAIGLAWKSGIAAEVIGIPGGSIGEKLYRAKVYLNTPDLFAWTIVIVLLSLLCEKMFKLLLAGVRKRIEGL